MNKALKVLYLYNGIFVFAAHLLGPLYAVYVREIEGDVLSVSISWAAFLFSTVIFTFLISRFGDKVKEKEYLLIAGYVVRSVVWLSYTFVSDLNFLIFLQILLGAGEALGTPSFDAIFAEHLDKGKHIADYANWKVVSNLACGIAVVIGGFVVKYYGFNILFFSMFILAVFSAIGILLKPRELL